MPPGKGRKQGPEADTQAAHLSPKEEKTFMSAQMTPSVINFRTVQTHIIGIYVCVIPLQAIIQYSNNNSFACNAPLPNGYHVEIQFGQSRSHPGVLLVKKNKETLVKLWFFLLNQELKAIFSLSVGNKEKAIGLNENTKLRVQVKQPIHAALPIVLI